MKVISRVNINKPDTITYKTHYKQSGNFNLNQDDS